MSQVECQYPLKQIFSNLEPFLTKPSPFSEESVEGMYEDYFNMVEEFEILVVGAGGLGCEIVKNLAVSGIRNIHLIDMDTIDLTNLNRQFLFREKDIGRKKAEVVAEFVMKRCPGVKVIPHTSKVQDLEYQFYTKFTVVIGGLDNVEARKFLNTMVHQINRDEKQTVCFYIDGATEGFQGQCLLVEPFVTSCYNCSLLEGLQDMPKANYCTIANTPRTPQHCIQYVLEIQWEKEFPQTKRDNDNLEHMKWVFEKSYARAQQFKIEGVTQMLTLGLSKNIIPAIASTNALIAAMSTNQAIKLIISSNPKLRNYFIYRGGVSVGSDTYEIQKKEGCPACLMRANKLETILIETSHDTTIEYLMKQIQEKNALVSAKSFLKINETTFNPFDKIRYAEQQNLSMADLQSKGIIKENPQLFIVNDKNLKEDQKIMVKIV